MLDLFACSGPGAGAFIAESIAIGYFHANVAGVLFLVALLFAVARFHYRLTWLAPILIGFVLAVHPAWTVSAIHGDCGFRLRAAAFNTSVVCGGILSIQMFIVVGQLLTSPTKVYSAVTCLTLWIYVI